MSFWMLMAVVVSLLGLSKEKSLLRCNQNFTIVMDMLLSVNRNAISPGGLVPVFVSVVVFHLQNSCFGFENCAGLLPAEFLHISGPSGVFPAC